MSKRFRTLKQKRMTEIPIIIDYHEVRPILKEMKLNKKPVEEKIIDLIMLGNTPNMFKTTKLEDKDEYYSTYTLHGLLHDTGTCRHRTAMLSAMLEEIGVDHEIENMLGGDKHPTIEIPLEKESLLIDFNLAEKKDTENPIAQIIILKKDSESKWEITHNRIRKVNNPTVNYDPKEKDLKKLIEHPHFKKGMDKTLLQRAIKEKKQSLRELKKSKFIGPKLAEKLYSLGISKRKQLSNYDAEELFFGIKSINYKRKLKKPTERVHNQLKKAIEHELKK